MIFAEVSNFRKVCPINGGIMIKKLVLTDLLKPFIEKDSITVGNETFEFGLRPSSDHLRNAEIEVVEKIQEELGLTDDAFDKFIEERDRQTQAVNDEIEKKLKKIKDPTFDQKIEARLKIREKIPYSTLARKYNSRWSKYIIPLYIRFTVVDPESGAPLFQNDDEVNNLSSSLRMDLTEKVDTYLLKQQMGALEAKK